MRFVLSRMCLTLCIAFVFSRAIEAQSPVGYRQYQWHDDSRDRPVWGDVWYPVDESVETTSVFYGLGRGHAARDAEIADAPERFPLVVVSHGAMGSGRDYSWIAEGLAQDGFVVLGVSHFEESWVYGVNTVKPEAVTKMWRRPRDCSFAIDLLLKTEEIGQRIDRDRVAALGHSSGGATAIMLSGVRMDPKLLADYCQSTDSEGDRGCDYGREVDGLPPAPGEARESLRDARVRALVALDPAVGPGFPMEELAQVSLPILVIGSVENDFLPFDHHAARIARGVPGSRLHRLENGEGHFIYLDECGAAIEANGVSLCRDREGVDRSGVHGSLVRLISDFLVESLRENGEVSTER